MPNNVSIELSNEELVTVRDAMRRLNQLVDALESGEVDKYVLMRKGKMVALVIPVDTNFAIVDKSRR